MTTLKIPLKVVIAPAVGVVLAAPPVLMASEHSVDYTCGSVELREVLACSRIDEMPIPSTPSFNCECEQCGARVWVAHTSPIEPIRMCVACSAAHDDKIQQAKAQRANRL